MTKKLELRPFSCLDLFEAPVSFKIDKTSSQFSDGGLTHLQRSLFEMNDKFFDAFEDAVFIQVVGSNSATVMVHFSTLACDSERAAMYRGWIYGYLQAKNIEYEVA